MPFTQAKTLSDRSYVGLVLSQFLAAFNDQAIHIVAIFYASDLLHGYVHSPYFDQKLIVSIVTACFISPFFFFSPLAGILADKFSKQRTIVFWKFAEVVITGLALFGFLLPHLAGGLGMDMKTAATTASFLLIASVFLMGTHSAFFVPAKYGIMPELLHNSVLSRGNGLLEGTSFVSQILGTSFGGYLYFFFKSRPDVAAVDTGGLRLGQEWIIGLTLFAFAFIGAAFSLLVARIPAASPERKLTLNPITPLAKNFGELKRSRPLVLATIGIAFFTFMTLFLRQTLLFQGETTKELNAARARLTQVNSTPNLTALADAVAAQTDCARERGASVGRVVDRHVGRAAGVRRRRGLRDGRQDQRVAVGIGLGPDRRGAVDFADRRVGVRHRSAQGAGRRRFVVAHAGTDRARPMADDFVSAGDRFRGRAVYRAAVHDAATPCAEGQQREHGRHE
ncbi:MAG: MFS transporter [Pirellulales bacterium]